MSYYEKNGNQNHVIECKYGVRWKKNQLIEILFRIQLTKSDSFPQKTSIKMINHLDV